MVLDLFDDEETISKIPEKEIIQKLCIYTEYLVMPNGEIKRGMTKSWVKGVKETKKLKSQTLTMPKMTIGEELLI